MDLSSLNRKVDKIIIHCSATPESMDIGAKEIDKWHKQRGWSGIGYHYVIRRDGSIEDGRPINKVGAHTLGYNTGSIGICMIGGIDQSGKAVSNFTKQQWVTLRQMIIGLKSQLKGVTIHGHREFAAKDCPSFDVQDWLKRENI